MIMAPTSAGVSAAVQRANGDQEEVAQFFMGVVGWFTVRRRH